MIKKIFLIAAMFAALNVNAQQQKIKLRGEYKAAPEGKILYLDKGYETLDSVAVKSGQFEFALKNIGPEEYLIKRIGDDGKPEYMMLYLDHYDTYVKMEAETFTSMNSRFIKGTINGNPTDSVMTEINKFFMSRQAEKLPKEQLKEKLKEWAGKGDMVAALTMRKYGKIYQTLLSIDELKTYLKGIKPEVMATQVGKKLLAQYNTFFKNSVGGTATDFNLTTSDGKSFNYFKFLKGKKRVLIYFWCTFYAEYKANNAELVKIYNKHHDKGLEIVSVYLDTDSTKWKNVIAEDGLTWTQVSDFKRWDSDGSRAYDIRQIPYMILMDGKGNILATGVDVLKDFDKYMVDLDK